VERVVPNALPRLAAAAWLYLHLRRCIVFGRSRSTHAPFKRGNASTLQRFNVDEELRW